MHSTYNRSPKTSKQNLQLQKTQKLQDQRTRESPKSPTKTNRTSIWKQIWKWSKPHQTRAGRTLLRCPCRRPYQTSNRSRPSQSSREAPTSNGNNINSSSKPSKGPKLSHFLLNRHIALSRESFFVPSAQTRALSRWKSSLPQRWLIRAQARLQRRRNSS